ncbi:hypothetical protein N7532_010089 [Penicillium argentinense]|uniref:Piwi domain-containing protein n=1 Tax=Penicillium argentinense TaxID=1131581 RepID=A0A9W9JXL1_9EURO|nr:uncharacterized protein N7532_010089 [Penicillium argentinense]KAJ5085318.1 hypothetical protein N7532_010089 [Penicillium argentinense]
MSTFIFQQNTIESTRSWSAAHRLDTATCLTTLVDAVAAVVTADEVVEAVDIVGEMAEVAVAVDLKCPSAQLTEAASAIVVAIGAVAAVVSEAMSVVVVVGVVVISGVVEAFVEIAAAEAEGAEALRSIGTSTTPASNGCTLAVYLFREPDSSRRVQCSSGQPVPTPDPNVAKVEDSLAKALISQKTSQAYPHRPGYGTQGEEVTLYANYLSLTNLGKPLYRYMIEIQKGSNGREPPAGKKARHIIALYIEQHFGAQKAQIATDYRSTIISYVDLNLAVDTVLPVTYKAEGEVEFSENPPVYDVRCSNVRPLDPADLLNYITSTNAGLLLDTKPELIAALNIIMGHHPKTSDKIVSVGANKHFGISAPFMDRQDLTGGLEVLRGFFVSVRAATARVLLNVQVKYLACYKEGSLANVITDFERTLDRRAQNSFVWYLDKFVSRMRVQTNHIKRKSKSGKERPLPAKTIAGLANKSDGRSSANPPIVSGYGAGPEGVQFFLNAPGAQSAPKTPAKKGKKAPAAGPAPAGRYVTVAQYFRENYNMKLDPNWPVINVGSKVNPTYVPVEVCQVLAGQPVTSKLSPGQTSQMLSFAVKGRSPAQNAESIATNGVDMLGLGNSLNSTLSSFGVGVNPGLITVQARVLKAPQVFYQGDRPINPLAGSWNMKQIKFTKPGRVTNWSYFVLSDRRNPWSPQMAHQQAIRFAGELCKMGISIEAPKKGVVLRDRPSRSELENAVVKLQKDYGRLDLVLGVMSGKDTTTYNSIKQVCDVICGVKNVNVQAAKLESDRGYDQYCANSMGLFGDGNTMLVGMDVTHPSPGSAKSAPSVASIVASVDKDLAQWPAEIVVQKAGQEIIDNLKTMLISRLKLWATHNENQYPENIVVYRDGVSEGQYNLVIDKELPQLKEACKTLYPEPLQAKGLPRMAIIIVAKRHNTRFYPTDINRSDRSNPQPGTVVDRGVSEARHWDFYLQAHSALQGTAKPAHYFTVWDEIFHPKFPANPNGQGAADVLQDLTHKMCYLFGRATKAVSVCPPAYYADLVCTRARCYLADVFDPSASPAGSVAGAESTELSSLPGAENWRPNEAIKNSMFYI